MSPVSPMTRARAVIDAYRSVTEEHDAALTVVRGEVPRALRGVLFRNGPGRVRIGPDVYDHPFDGDGMITRFAFEDGRVRYRNRYVRTRELREEERAGRMRYRAFGTNKPGGLPANLLRLRFKNAANTNVVFHGGHLLALWEGGLPHTLDPVTLETRERFDYHGALTSAAGRDPVERLAAPALPYAAHPHVDPASGELFSFGTLLGRTHRLMLYRVGPEGRLTVEEPVPLEELAFVHDFVLTARYRVFFLTPVSFDVARALLGVVSPAAGIRMRPGAPTRILLVPRDRAEPVRTLEAPSCFVFHHINGYDAEDGAVVVDALRMDRYPDGQIDFDDPASVLRLVYPPPRPTRFVLRPDTGEVESRVLAEAAMELPRVNPERLGRPYRYAWAQAAADPEMPDAIMNCVARLDVETGALRKVDLAPDLPAEPVFVPRPGAASEDDGWVLTLVYRAAAGRSDLVIHDGRDLSEVAALRLPHHVPPGFHGNFVTDPRVRGAPPVP